MQDSLHGGGNIFLNCALCSELCRIVQSYDEPILNLKCSCQVLQQGNSALTIV